MVRNDPHMSGLKHRFLQAIFNDVEEIDSSTQALLAAPVERAARVVDQILARLEYGERALIELLFGLGDGYRYNHDQAADLFHILPDHLPYEANRILGKCRQVLEHIGV